MILEGDLREVPLVQLLHHMHFCGKNGTLMFEKGRSTKMVYFVGGDIVYASSNRPEERVGAFLVAQGIVSVDDLKAALLKSERLHLHLTDVLLQSQLVERQRLGLALKELAERILFDLSSWSSGMFRYLTTVPSEVQQAVTVAATGTLMEGIRRYSEWLEVQRVISTQTLAPQKRPVSEGDPRLDFMTPAQREVYDLADGYRTIRDLCQCAHSYAFETLVATARLVTWGLIELGERVDRGEPTGELGGVVSVPGATVGLGGRPLSAVAKTCEQAWKLAGRGQHRRALDILEMTRSSGTYDLTEEDRSLLDRTRREIEADYLARLVEGVGPGTMVPRRVENHGGSLGTELTLDERFLLTQVDGRRTIDEVIEAARMQRLQGYEVLATLLRAGAIRMPGGGGPRSVGEPIHIPRIEVGGAPGGGAAGRTDLASRYEYAALRASAAGQFEVALRHIQRAAELAPNEDRFRGRLAELRAQADHQIALRLFKQAEVARRRRSFDKAYELVSRAIEKDEGTPHFHALAAKILLQGRMDVGRAVDHAQLALRGDGKNPDFHFLMGKALERLGDRTRALAAYQQALTLNPDHEAARRALGQVTS